MTEWNENNTASCSQWLHSEHSRRPAPSFWFNHLHTDWLRWADNSDRMKSKQHCQLLTMTPLRTFSASSSELSISSMLLVTTTSPPDIMLRWLPLVHRRPLVSADEPVSLRAGVGNVPLFWMESCQHTISKKKCIHWIGTTHVHKVPLMSWLCW